jgi:CubicO group peptidase (beta-lactamase class C family)
MYGLGLDWAGEAIRAVTGLALDKYMAQHVWAPLGITHMTFWPQTDPALAALVPDVCERDTATDKVGVARVDRYNTPAQEPLGGGGVLAQPAEYIKVLTSLLRDDGKLLRPATAALLFEPQLQEAPREALRALVRGNPGARLGLARGMEDEGIIDHGLGGLVQTEALPGHRGKGTLLWGGLPNLTWFVDREKGLCGMTAAQMIPPFEQLLVDLGNDWERGLYERYGEWRDGRA